MSVSGRVPPMYDFQFPSPGQNRFVCSLLEVGCHMICNMTSQFAIP